MNFSFLVSTVSPQQINIPSGFNFWFTVSMNLLIHLISFNRARLMIHSLFPCNTSILNLVLVFNKTNFEEWSDWQFSWMNWTISGSRESMWFSGKDVWSDCTFKYTQLYSVIHNLLFYSERLWHNTVYWFISDTSLVVIYAFMGCPINHWMIKMKQNTIKINRLIRDFYKSNIGDVE